MKSLVDSLADALSAAARKAQETLRCPKCKKPVALAQLVFLGRRVADVCRFCDYVKER